MVVRTGLISKASTLMIVCRHVVSKASTILCPGQATAGAMSSAAAQPVIMSRSIRGKFRGRIAQSQHMSCVG